MSNFPDKTEELLTILYSSNTLFDWFKIIYSLVWWHTPLIPTLNMQRQVNFCEFKGSLVYYSMFWTSQGCVVRSFLKKESYLFIQPSNNNWISLITGSVLVLNSYFPNCSEPCSHGACRLVGEEKLKANMHRVIYEVTKVNMFWERLVGIKKLRWDLD